MQWGNKKVLIAGGAGMIGSHLAKELVGMGAFVIVVDDLSSGSQKNLSGIACDFVRSDLRVEENCQRVMQGMDYVFQFAANMGGIQHISSIGANIMRDNSLININMLHIAQMGKVKCYLFSSVFVVCPHIAGAK